MTFTGLSYLATSLLWWWLASAAIGSVVGWATVAPGASRGWAAWVVLLGVGIAIACAKLLTGRAGLWFDIVALFVTVYFLGCCIGSLARQMLFGKAAAEQAQVGTSRSTVPAEAVSKPVAAVETIKPYQWQAARDGNVLTLTGYVPSQDVKGRISNAVKAMLPKLTVIDRLKTGHGAPRALETMAGAAFGHLAKLETGVASLVDQSYTLTGTAASAANRSAILKMTGLLPGGYTLDKADIGVKGDVPVVSGLDIPSSASPSDAAPIATLSGPTVASLLLGDSATIPVPSDDDKPAGLDAPRGGTGDDLKLVRGIGRQNESRLHELGIWHFDQIAAWTPLEVAWVGHFLAFSGRIERENWVAQAAALRDGGAADLLRPAPDASLSAASHPAATIVLPDTALSAPRNGKPDTLTYISGIDRSIETALNALGLFHFDQIAQLPQDMLNEIATSVGAAGKALLDNWKGEAAILAVGGETDHSKLMKQSTAAPSSQSD